MVLVMERGPWIVALVLAVAAGWTDWRWRRIPNWLTVPALVLGFVANVLAQGWHGAGTSLLGAVLGLLLLLPFVLLRSLGAGDWKLMGAMGGCVGPHHLIPVLLVAVLVNGIIAFAMIVAKKRVRETATNLMHMLAAILTLHMPGAEVTLDNPDAIKVPFGVAAAIAAGAISMRHIWRAF